MQYYCLVLSVGICLIIFGCTTTQETDKQEFLEAPVAKIVPRQLEKHGDIRIDNYYWLKEREDREVIDYLKAENNYTQKKMVHTELLQTKLYHEIKGRIKQTDLSVPYKLDDYFYYYRYEEGKEYPIYNRKRDSLKNREEVMIDVNEIAEGQEFCSVRLQEVSSNQDILAFAVDTVGRRKYTIHFKNLDTGEMINDRISDVTGNMAWANDNRTLFYTRQDRETLRSYQVYRHILGTSVSKDKLVYEEEDETFSIYVSKTKSKQYITIASIQTLSHEYRYLDADDPSSDFSLFSEREKDHEYDIDHIEDKFIIRTNDQAENFRLMVTPVGQTGRENWVEHFPHRKNTLLENFMIFKDHLVVQERHNGLVQFRMIPWDEGEEHTLDFGEPAYTAYLSKNPVMNSPYLRYSYSSMTTPNSVFDYNRITREKKLLKQDEILGDFDSKNYRTERLFATASDGTRIPISLVYRVGMKKDGNHPLLLYGYGSYGSSMNANFRSSRLSLIDRGLIFAIAHVRGGEELGRSWYHDGKLLKKKNTFTDFTACGEYLIKENYTCSEKMFAMGGSAGGLLMGAIMNRAPDLFYGIIAQVPWVDVVTTMLDSSIPLTTSEYDEWGDPDQKEYYDYMLSYSPYDNVDTKDYPNLLVTTSIFDSQVQYWEPAKWVAKLRAKKTDQNLLLLKTNMDAGHGGPSGRFKRYRDTAFIYAFVLDLLNISE